MDLLQQACEAQARALIEFGYPSVTADIVRSHHEAWKRGDTAKDVIFAFNVSAFEKHPALFGAKTAEAAETPKGENDDA